MNRAFLQLGKVYANDDFNAFAVVINLTFQPQIHGKLIDERAKSDPLHRSKNLKFSSFHTHTFMNCAARELFCEQNALAAGGKSVPSAAKCAPNLIKFDPLLLRPLSLF